MRLVSCCCLVVLLGMAAPAYCQYPSAYYGPPQYPYYSPPYYNIPYNPSIRTYYPQPAWNAPPSPASNPPAPPPVKQAPKSLADFLDSSGPPPAPRPVKAQTVPPPTTKQPEPDTRPSVQFVKEYFQVEAVRPSRFWVRGENLLWYVKKGTSAYPLVTTDTNPASPTAGSLASPTAVPLFGQNGFHYPAMSGGRFTLGYWLDICQNYGLEGSGFVLQRRSSGFSAASDALGNPPLYIPAFNVALGREDRLVVSTPNIVNPNNFVGSVNLTSILQLWGAEANGVFTVIRGNRCDVDLLAGFRYLDMNEAFQLQNTTGGLNSVVTINDRFQAHNHFYGAQIGTRVNYSWCRAWASLTSKIAVGGTSETVDISGSTLQTGLVNGNFPSGFFAQTSNSGLHQRNLLSVVPQVGMTIGYNVTPRLTFYGGYDFLYWTHVARAGDQIDRNLNLTQSPTFGTGILVGPARPQVTQTTSDFFVHGASLGLEYRY
jgi:Putative beta barrel porin-7 (BBP7)